MFGSLYKHMIIIMEIPAFEKAFFGAGREKYCGFDAFWKPQFTNRLIYTNSAILSLYNRAYGRKIHDYGENFPKSIDICSNL